jgi:hypothetical protein
MQATERIQHRLFTIGWLGGEHPAAEVRAKPDRGSRPDAGAVPATFELAVDLVRPAGRIANIGLRHVLQRLRETVERPER